MRWMLMVQMPDGETRTVSHYNNDGQMIAGISLNLPGTVAPLAMEAFENMNTDRTSVSKSGYRVEISRVYEEDLND